MAKVSQGEVDQAAAKVLAQVQQSGGKLTLKKVMDQVKADTGRAGDTGLVSDLLTNWKASYGTAQIAAPIRIDVPEAVKTAFSASLSEMWHQAEEAANSRLKSEREAIEAERGRMQESMKGFYAQTGENFRTPLILLESLHKGDFWVRPASLLPTDGLKPGVTWTVVHMTPKNSIKIDPHSVTLAVTWTTSREGCTK